MQFEETGATRQGEGFRSNTERPGRCPTARLFGPLGRRSTGISLLPCVQKTRRPKEVYGIAYPPNEVSLQTSTPA